MADHIMCCTEVWTQIPSIPTHEASSHGRVRRIAGVRNWKAGKVLSTSVDGRGYQRITIAGRCRSVHSLVCESFNGPRPTGKICRHLDDDKTNNAPDNLAWGTYLDNFLDAKRNGRLKCKRVYDLAEASRLRSIGLTVREIGYWLHVSQAAIAYGLKYGTP